LQIFQSHFGETRLGSGKDEVNHLAVMTEPEALHDDADQDAFADHEQVRIGAARSFRFVDDLSNDLSP
jgi:hypothetical protein